MIFEFKISTNDRTDFVDITDKIRRYITEQKIENGICTIFTPHTTAAITINENADPAVTHDMSLILDKMIPWNSNQYRHMEGNSAAHVKSSMYGCSETVIISNGQLVLGTWQGIYFCDFDGPKSRRVLIKIS